MTSTLDIRTQDLQAKAAVLHEALPWIKRYAGRTVVVKYGGAAMARGSGGLEPGPPVGGGGAGGLEPSPPVDGGPAEGDSFVDDVVLLRYVGVDVVVVHGGGPEISELMQRFGKQPRFVAGHRVTDEETIDLVRMVLVGRVNKALVGRFNRHGRIAVGLSGEDGLLVTARPRVDPGGADLGYVGDVDAVDPTALRALTAAGLIPVVATVAAGPGGRPYNVNADAVAGALAAALGAEKLIYLTDVHGLYADLGDERSLIRRIAVADLEPMLAEGRFAAGIVPKLHGIVTALRAGVAGAHILDGRLKHALLLELFTDQGAGTMVQGATGPTGQQDPTPPTPTATEAAR